MRPSRGGTAATEFAVTAPLLILLALATGDFGRAFHFREAVSNAARVGASTAASRGFTAYTRAAWEADARAAVIAEMANLPQFDESKLDFDLTVDGAGDGVFLVAASVAYPFRPVVAWPALPSAVTIRERVAMPRFR
jgi:Flp pilus assembly protein TadG